MIEKEKRVKMTIEDKIFKKKIPNFHKLTAYGFEKENHQYLFQTFIMNKQFKVRVIVSQSNQVNGQVIDTDTGEEYTLVHADN